MARLKLKCKKCKKEIDVNQTVCFSCGTVVVQKKAMISKKELNNMKEI